MTSLHGLKEMACILVAALVMVGSLSETDATVVNKAPAQCPAGFATCKTGRTCQTVLGSDVDNCGSCCAKCPRAPHSLPKCQNGTCGIYCNDREWNDCDGNRTNGCETNVNSNPQNCGKCGTVCPVPQNGNATCCRGVCGIKCASGFKQCPNSNGCSPVQNTITNCGGCGQVCPVPSNGDAATCSAAGSCGFTCRPGFKNCDLKSNNGCEINIMNDRANCGTCGNVCKSPPNSDATCSNGTCGFTCHAGFKDCDGNPFNGCETSIQVNGNCGDCGVTCDRPHLYSFCDSSEIYPGEFFCTYRFCDAGWADCDSDPLNGCETNTVSDSANCGACNTTCSSGTCYASTCTSLNHPPPPPPLSCPSGYADCDGNPSNGCETDVQADLNNCGACNRTCVAVNSALTGYWENGTTICSDGVCSVDCDEFYMANCDGDTSNGCETWYSDSNNCNKCGYSCYRPHVYDAYCAGSEFGNVTGVGSDGWVETNVYSCGGFICEDGWQNCDGDWLNGCELPSSVTCYAAPPPP